MCRELVFYRAGSVRGEHSHWSHETWWTRDWPFSYSLSDWLATWLPSHPRRRELLSGKGVGGRFCWAVLLSHFICGQGFNKVQKRWGWEVEVFVPEVADCEFHEN
jgi:hypothetical protein